MPHVRINNPVELKAEPQMTVHMAGNSEALDEVVVVGYQTLKKG